MMSLDNATCPKCGRLVDATTGVETGAPPAAGDFSLCFYCGELLRFTGGNPALRVAVDAELDELDARQRKMLRRLRSAILDRGGDQA